MLFISLPTDQYEGNCRINGQEAQYKFEGGKVGFRYEQSDTWDFRRILRVSDGDSGFIDYTCAGADESSECPEPLIIEAVMPRLVPPVRPELLASLPSIHLKHLPVDKDLVAKAVHQAVCEFSGTDGSRMCMSHAIAGSWLLTQITGRTHVPQVGSLRFLVEPPDGWIEIDIQHWGDSVTSLSMGEFHAWIVSADTPIDGNHQNVVVIDLTTCYLKKLAEGTTEGEAITWTRPDPPPFLWAAAAEIPDWICLAVDEAATKAVWKMFAESKSDWEPLCRLSFAKYELLLERKQSNACRKIRRFTRKAARQRRRKSHR